jgi:hypothetical protein
MKALEQAAIVLLVVALILMAMGGIADLLTVSYRFTKEHAWSDGIFLAVVAVALLLLSRAT